MSASLVGSEMCIRDSPASAQLIPAAGPRNTQLARSSRLPLQIPNLLTEMWLEGVRRCESARWHTPIRDPPTRNPRSPCLFALESPIILGRNTHRFTNPRVR
eukprot:6422852-Alexandrium_andersonii.AAC.1